MRKQIAMALLALFGAGVHAAPAAAAVIRWEFTDVHIVDGHNILVEDVTTFVPTSRFYLTGSVVYDLRRKVLTSGTVRVQGTTADRTLRFDPKWNNGMTFTLGPRWEDGTPLALLDVYVSGDLGDVSGKLAVEYADYVGTRPTMCIGDNGPERCTQFEVIASGWGRGHLVGRVSPVPLPPAGLLLAAGLMPGLWLAWRSRRRSTV